MLPVILMLLTLFDSTRATAKCDLNCTNSQVSALICHDLHSWSEAIKSINSINCTNRDLIVLKPLSPILLTSELSFVSTTYPSFFIYGVSGVNVYPWNSVCSNCAAVSLGLSNIEFYVNNQPPSQYTCSPSLVPSGSSFFQSYLLQLTLIGGNTYGSSAVCPYLFTSAYIYDGISLKFQVESFLFVSQLRFQTIDSNTSTENIDSTILSLDVTGYNYILDTGLLHPLVFRRAETLSCAGKLNGIQSGLFEPFKDLDSIQFTLNSLINFYHQIGIEWMSSLNNNSNVTLSSRIPYTYPDRDFCIFTGFPQNKGIALYLDTTSSNGSTLIFELLCTFEAITGSFFNVYRKYKLKIPEIQTIQNRFKLFLCE
jgi:hypothetical protein